MGKAVGKKLCELTLLRSIKKLARFENVKMAKSLNP
jgi:hypothetical protein